MQAPSASCASWTSTPATSVAVCPAGFHLTGGGSTLITWNPAANWSSNAVNSSYPLVDQNAWAVWAGGQSANSCFVAFAVCVQ